MRFLLPPLALVWVLFSGFTAFAASKLTPDGSDAWHLLGDSLSISGNTVAIAAPGLGKVYIREYQAGTGWVTAKVLTVPGDYVKLSANHLAVRDSDKLRMFERNQGGTGNWGLAEELILPAGGIALDGNRLLAELSGGTASYDWNPTTRVWDAGQSFGTSPPLALSGNTAVLGGPDAFGSAGAVGMYERNASGQWSLTATVVSPVSFYRDVFGASVGIEGDWMVVGALGSYSGNNAGAAYVFNRNQGGTNKWGYKQTLTPVGATLEFGIVSMSGSRIAVGMIGASQALHVYERAGSTYSLKGRFLPSVPYSVSFGRVMGISGDRLIASDLWRNVPNNYAGAIFGFDVTAGTPATITPHSSLFSSPAEAVAEDFGRSVAMEGDTMIVGVPGSDNPMSDGGDALVYTRQANGTWTFLKRLVPDDIDIQAHFGSAVALQGDTLAVAANGNGTIYIFGRNTGGANQWGLVKKLGDYTYYTTDLSLSGDTLAAVGLCIFERNFGGPNAWGVKTLPESGQHVALDGNTVIESGGGSGAAVATRSVAGATDWQFTTFISTPYPFYYLGASSLDGDTVAIQGEESQSGLSRPKEIVTIRQRNQGGAGIWGEVARLAPPDRTGVIGFGQDVKLKGNLLVVGAPLDTTDGLQSGSIYVYRGSTDRTTWTLIRKIRQSDPATGDRFGTALDTNGDDIAGGAPLRTGASVTEGAVYISSTTSHFAEWVAQNAPTAGANPETYDGDGDGVKLYQEYAMGLSPTAKEPAPTRLIAVGTGGWSFDYSLAKDAPDVETLIEWSSDLKTWKAVGDGLSLTSSMISETRDGWGFRAMIPASSMPSLFLRLRTTHRP